MLALGLAPLPHSDWLLYWESAGDPAAYERGGVGLWLLAVPKALGLGPVLASLVLNLAAGLLVLWIAWMLGQGRRQGWAILTCAYLFLLAPYVGIVQLDMIAAAFLAGALACLLRSLDAPGRRRFQLAAVALLAAGVSTKPQYALLAWTLVIVLALPAWLRRRQEPWAPALVGVLLVGSLLGYALDNGLRGLSGRSEALRTSSAVTLYAGLLVSRTENCGYWSPEAARAAREDKDKSLPLAIRDRLAAQPPIHWRAVIWCKLPQVLRPPAFSLYWLLEAPSVKSRVAASPSRMVQEARYQRAIDAERSLYGVVTFLLLLGVAAGALLAWRRGHRFAALVPVAWVLSFWAVHLVFEIQGRYFLGMYLLAPLFSAFALAAASRRPSPGAVECGVTPYIPPEPTR
ncbi:hypothetical protein GCM10011521_15870 [Arenimonas soli]|uniref:Glycosyltransferase RgtA/B/C/D-like domain-containing protein n=1 Tax=Arenimonas soli TaxID=2269504 RepID=A0ABQ1HIX0_9GAMM|nr:hypothetical protein GCM10011521_15870 [Arenimonas soli]